MSRRNRKKQKGNVPGMIPLADLRKLQEDMFARAQPIPDSITVLVFEYNGQRFTTIGYEPKYWGFDA